MWISIMGAPGTCKHDIANYLVKKHGMILAEAEKSKYDFNDGFPFQMETMINRFRLQRDLQKGSESEHVQVGTFWDSHIVYSSALDVFELLGPSYNFDLLDRIFRVLCSLLKSPDGLIYCYNKKIEASNRIGLKEKAPVQEEMWDYLDSQFEWMVKSRIRMRVVEVDVSIPFDRLTDDIDSFLNGFRGEALSESIWSKDFLK